ncbi:MAG: hypothetical protein ACK5Q5_22565 [Planctomycetaceae bacterium]
MNEATAKSAADRFLLGAPPQPRGRTATVLTTLAVVTILAVMTLCAGGLYYFRPYVNEDPNRVAVVQAEMLGFTPPAGFNPRGTIEWNLFSSVLMRGAYYELATRDGMLMLLQVDSRLLAEADVRQHVERTLREKGGGGLPLTITSTKEVTFPIRGELVPFQHRVGKSPTDQTEYQLIEGVVAGRAGEVLIAFRIASDVWPELEGAIRSSIEGIK